MQKIFLSGCNGRMGRAVAGLCAGRRDAYIVAGLDVNTEKHFDFPVYADPMEYGGRPHVALDFSAPVALLPLLAYCRKKTLPLVLATTGYDEAQQAAVHAAAAEIPIFQSGNMSLGINLLLDLVRRACAVLGEGFDVEIIEKHHSQKLDAPSGTALMLCRAAAESLPYEAHPVYDRHERRARRDPHEIGLHAVRGGSIVGEHIVLFAGHHEVIEISHSAGSREVFAAGALRAALYLAGVTRPGLYGMDDMLRA
ncbi:MAG: 4-hydroxy-tetrahydrodipicolinate reductase [Oscillospiraceae bacterium]|jgi:4-hydroxy-tetrahydrodipicolinate reductase|nr:4-hydroxy-tetrahydrodipicolinate reductase [Oscillospiraceae bacterium]